MSDEQSVKNKKFYLHSGRPYPAIGLSTYRIRMMSLGYYAIDEALASGYRFFDTSPTFCNEEVLGKVIHELLPKYNLTRRDIIISSKLITVENRSSKCVREECMKSLNRLGLDYIDLYLISSSLSIRISLTEAWSVVLELQREGYVTSVGVANFNVPQLQMIMNDSNYTPMVNQVEFHPLRCDEKLYEFCMSQNILIQAYSPFGLLLSKFKPLFMNCMLRELAVKYSTTVAQVLLMWGLQHGLMILPASGNTLHLRENINFELKLSDHDLGRISDISGPYDGSNTTT